jgi:4-diphosphocytidyl-2-C-methyl-D-erythritol kinase
MGSSKSNSTAISINFVNRKYDLFKISGSPPILMIIFAFMVTFPNAKINLGLEVLRKRSDGYHDIASVFYPIPLCDALEIVPAQSKTRWHFSGKVIPGNTSDNLLVKALERLREETSVFPMDVFLHKAIPMGAGLGGGSADAAFFLRMVNALNGNKLSTEKLMELAARLGSDCPFFVKPRPAYAEGRGERLSPLPEVLSGKKLMLVCPDLHVSTARAYQMIEPRETGISPKEILRLPVTDWRNRLVNRFEEAVFSLHPELKWLKKEIYELGAVYASMTGSGSAFYGIFEDELPEETPSTVAGEVYRLNL